MFVPCSHCIQGTHIRMLTLAIQSEQGTNIRMLILVIQSEQGTHIIMLTLEIVLLMSTF
jgi:hypothetical protein